MRSELRHGCIDHEAIIAGVPRQIESQQKSHNAWWFAYIHMSTKRFLFYKLVPKIMYNNRGSRGQLGVKISTRHPSLSLSLSLSLSVSVSAPRRASPKEL
jgi:hypothetical protein